MTLSRTIALSLALALPPALGAAQTEGAQARLAEAYLAPVLPERVERFYWQQTLDLLAKYELAPTEEELAAMREAARPVVAGTVETMIKPAMALAAETFTEGEAEAIAAALAEGGPEAIADPELAAAFQSYRDGLNALMQGEMGARMMARLGNYRFEAWDVGTEAGFIPDGLLGTR